MKNEDNLVERITAIVSSIGCLDKDDVNRLISVIEAQDKTIQRQESLIKMQDDIIKNIYNAKAHLQSSR